MIFKGYRLLTTEQEKRFPLEEWTRQPRQKEGVKILEDYMNWKNKLSATSREHWWKKMMFKKEERNGRKVWTAKYWTNRHKVLNKSGKLTENKDVEYSVVLLQEATFIMVVIKTMPPITLEITFWGRDGHAAIKQWSCWSHEMSIDYWSHREPETCSSGFWTFYFVNLFNNYQIKDLFIWVFLSVSAAPKNF